MSAPLNKNLLTGTYNLTASLDAALVCWIDTFQNAKEQQKDRSFLSTVISKWDYLEKAHLTKVFVHRFYCAK